MKKYRNAVQDSNGNAIRSATITVKDYPSGSTSTIYSDDAGTAKANPFTSSGVDGVIEFYAENGHYTISIDATGYDIEDITDEYLFEPTGLSAFASSLEIKSDTTATNWARLDFNNQNVSGDNALLYVDSNGLFAIRNEIDSQYNVIYARDSVSALNTCASFGGTTSAANLYYDDNLILSTEADGISNKSIKWYVGSGTPESVVTAPVGSLYSRTDGGTSTTLYVKESGVGNTGWIAK